MEQFIALRVAPPQTSKTQCPTPSTPTAAPAPVRKPIGTGAKRITAADAALDGADRTPGRPSPGRKAQTAKKTRAGSRVFAQKTAHLAGRPVAFILAAATIVVWAVTGPLFGYSDTWQLVINTGTTIVTFLMVFLIQNSQNRDLLAFQIKLDELIIACTARGNEIAGAEDLCDADLEALHDAYRKRASHRAGDAGEARAARPANAAGDGAIHAAICNSRRIFAIHSARWQPAPTILVFDSGLGGLTVFREVVDARPDARFVYAADDAFFPYGRQDEPELVAARARGDGRN